MALSLRDFQHPTYHFDDQVILITGATGSFGRACVQMIVENHRPRKLIIFSRDEWKQFEMQYCFSTEKYPFLRYFIGDIRDQARLETAFRGVDVVIHAAALKQVPVAEYNPFECIHTNVIGAENIVNAALKNSVSRVIALSTDKAVNPINLYGASKLAAEKIFLAANNIRGEKGALFSVARYGNVIGSRGSVIPFFKKMIEENSSRLPITDEEMTRFWITLSQAVSFISSSLTLMQGGEIFIPKVPSMKIVDLARALAPHMPHEYIGIRSGEKVHELLFSSDEARHVTALSDRFVLKPLQPPEENSATGGETPPSYTSNNNEEWLSVSDLQEILHRQESLITM